MPARRIGWVLALWLVQALPAAAAERVALVIGNNAYRHAPDLVNPLNDAADIAAALGRLGFSVTALSDADKQTLERGLQGFSRQASGAEIAAVFYAGHGIEIDERNFLVPVDARLRTDTDIKYEAVPLDLVMDTVAGASRLRLVVLDACRENPFRNSMQRTGATRSLGRGLAHVEPTGETLVAYAAKEGTVAADGEGRNSPYTEALLRFLEEPGLELGLMFRKVRDAVLASTGQAQEPFVYGSLSSKGVFLKRLGAASPTTGGGTGSAQAPSPDATGFAPAGDPSRIFLPNGMSLSDWALLAEDDLKAGAHARILEEADAHIRDHGRLALLANIREQAVSGLVARVEAVLNDDVRAAMAQIARLEASLGTLPVLLRLEARAHRLLGDYEQEAAAYVRWLRAASQSHPDRRQVLTALTQARAVLDQGERFSKLLGRPFSAEAPENAAGWTDLHHAAVMNLPAVAAALIDAGMAVDTRMKEDSTPIGDDVKQMLAALGLGEAFKDWSAEGDTPLNLAARADALDTVALLLDRGADIHAGNNFGTTPLHHAAVVDAGNAVRLLLDRGADMHVRRKNGETALHFAAIRNAYTTAELLLERGAEIDATREDGKTALHRTAPRDARETARLLLDRGADVNARSNGGWTPLHEAARQNARETAELLLDRGADVTLNSDNGASPLYSAAAGNAREIAEALLDGAVHVNVRTNTGWTPLHSAARQNARETAELLLDRGADVALNSDNGTSPLHSAASGNAREIAEAFLDRGVDVNARTNTGWTPLHSAARQNVRETAELLLERGAEVNAENDGRATPLIVAARWNARATAEFLLDHDAEMGVTHKDSLTPLHYAAFGNARATAELLLDRGADANVTTANGWTPLHEAAKKNARETAELLLDHGAKVGATRDDGWTPLHEVASSKSRGTAELLLDRGADVHARIASGATPLHLAAASNARGIAELFIDRGADINAKTDDGETPLHHAAQENAHETAKLLLLAGAADIDVTYPNGATLLHHAARETTLDTARLLLKRGANVNAKDADDNAPLAYAATRVMAEYLVEHGADINAMEDCPYEGWTPLMCAARSNSAGWAELLIELGAGVDETDGDYTPLLLAIGANFQNLSGGERSDLAAYLIGRGADVNARESEFNSFHRTPLMYAALANDRDLAELLLAHGADVNATDDYGTTALSMVVENKLREMVEYLISHGGGPVQDGFMIAVCNNDVELAKFLLEHGADASRQVDTSPIHRANTPLYHAVRCRAHDSAAFLVNRGVDVNAQIGSGSTPLHEAARQGATELMELLVAHGAEVNVKAEYGMTPLMAAIQDSDSNKKHAKQYETVEFLVTRGADVNARNENGRTPLHYVTSGYLGGRDGLENAIAIARFLVARGADINAKNNDGKTPLDNADWSEYRERLHDLGARCAKSC